MTTVKRKAPAKKATPTIKKSASKKSAAAKKTAKAKTAPTAKAKPKVSAIPKGYHTAIPYLVIRDAASAIGFYTKAFGAKEKVRMSFPDGKVMHAEIKIGDSVIMLSEENPAWGSRSPQALGGSAAHVMLCVKNVDAFVAAAVQAGASITMPIADQFWGDRFGKITDPFGHEWSVATHIEDVSPKEMKKRADAFMKQMAQG
jgi:PhnB protein